MRHNDVCMNDEEQYQFGFSRMVRAATDAAFRPSCTPARMLSFTPIVVIWGMSIEKQRRGLRIRMPYLRLTDVK